MSKRQQERKVAEESAVPTLDNHPNSEVRELYAQITGYQGTLGSIKSDGNLNDIQRNLRLNQVETEITAKTRLLHEKIFMDAIGGDTSVFINLVKYRSGQPLGSIKDLDAFVKLATVMKGDFCNPQVAEDMKASNEAIADAQSKIVELNEIIRNERIHQTELMKEEFLINPVKVAVEFPDQLKDLTGKVYVNSTAGKPAGSTGTPKQYDVTGDKEGIPEQDHKDLMGVVTEDNIREAVESGVDSQSNADILRWLALNKLGREMQKARHTAHSSVYVHRKKLGWA